MRGMLKRASVVCHPKSEPRKKIARDTQQDPIPHLSVSYGGSSASGTQPSTTTSTDQNTSTSDVTREVRRGPTQDVTRTRSNDDIGGDVVMRGDNADENRAEHPSSSRSDSRRRITTKREPREVGDAQTSVTEQHVPRRISKKTTWSEHPVAVTAQGHWTEKTMKVPERREQCIELGVNSISRSSRHDALRLQREVGT